MVSATAFSANSRALGIANLILAAEVNRFASGKARERDG
jgi:hypothetical protein